MYKVSVIGASGYAGQEVLRLLSTRSDIEIEHLMAASSAGKRMGEIAPNLISLKEKILESVDIDKLSESDVIFFALPHGKSGEFANSLIDKYGEDTPLLLDLGADFRLKSEEDWAEYYGSEYAGCWDYGLPELDRIGGINALRKSKKIAVPGCNVTAVTLALLPAVKFGLINLDDITATLAVGYSGAGKSLKPHLIASEAINCSKPYAIGGTHRHIPEIIQNIKIINPESDKQDINLTFTPVLVPMTRGILATVSARLNSESKNISTSEILKIYQNVYKNEKFIDICFDDEMPSTASILGSNFAKIKPVVDKKSGRLIMFSAIDNLVR
ncbi:MAG: N-acetyl-gamma-glutamyl-phosphate reductase, partial [Candidatus Ancillula sp.]|nr:N-acetyl-gamma-glutamyl-phosphate reductase [Candidatus Ancillula sp.]